MQLLECDAVGVSSMLKFIPSLLPMMGRNRAEARFGNRSRMVSEYSVGVQTEYSVGNRRGRPSAAAVRSTFFCGVNRNFFGERQGTVVNGTMDRKQGLFHSASE